jgi:hypothetical protein
MRILDSNLVTAVATALTPSSADMNFPVSNLKHPFRSKRWRSTGCVSENVVFDMQTTQAIDSVVILWPKEDGIKLTNTAVIRIQGSATNSWSSPAVDQTLTVNNDYLIASHFFPTVQNYRYWRVLVTDSANPWGYIELGVVWLGSSLSVPNCQNGFKIKYTDQSTISTTAFGHRYVDIYPQIVSLEFGFNNLEYAAVQILDSAFRTNGGVVPTLVVLDELGTVFASDHFTLYGMFDPKFGLSHQTYNLLTVDTIILRELS